MRNNEHPPIPIGSKMFRWINGRWCFRCFVLSGNPAGDEEDWISVGLLVSSPGVEGAYWRTIIGAVAAEEWIQIALSIRAEKEPCYYEPGGGNAEWERWSDSQIARLCKTDKAEDAWREWAREGKG